MRNSFWRQIQIVKMMPLFSARTALLSSAPDPTLFKWNAVGQNREGGCKGVQVVSVGAGQRAEVRGDGS